MIGSSLLLGLTLHKFVGQSIGDICPFGYSTTKHGTSHCAHFVSHALSLHLDGTLLCGDMMIRKTRHKGATIRVNDLFNRVSHGPWDDRPQGATKLLIFVTRASNISHDRMNDDLQKHVGVFWSGSIYNYSNTLHRVVRDSEDSFQNKFKHSYHRGGSDISFYYGLLS